MPATLSTIAGTAIAPYVVNGAFTVGAVAVTGVTSWLIARAGFKGQQASDVRRLERESAAKLVAHIERQVWPPVLNEDIVVESQGLDAETAALITELWLVCSRDVGIAMRKMVDTADDLARALHGKTINDVDEKLVGLFTSARIAFLDSVRQSQNFPLLPRHLEA